MFSLRAFAPRYYFVLALVLDKQIIVIFEVPTPFKDNVDGCDKRVSSEKKTSHIERYVCENEISKTEQF